MIFWPAHCLAGHNGTQLLLHFENGQVTTYEGQAESSEAQLNRPQEAGKAPGQALQVEQSISLRL